MLLGFLVVDRVETADGWMGGYLITDERGYPREFRTTNPVRPTPVQQALFGSGLPAFIGIELSGRRLLDAASNTAAAVLVDDPVLLRLAARPHTTVMHLERPAAERRVDPATGEIVEAAPDAQPSAHAAQFPTAGVWQHGRLGDPAGALAPIVYRGAFAPGTAPADLVLELAGALVHFDLLEAFQRVRTALEIVGGQVRHGP